MQLDWLADVLRAEDLTIIEHTGWKSRTLRPFDQYHPEGLINHHTAGSAVIPNYPHPPYYRNEALEDKCNLTIRPDGVVVVLNAGYAADSGLGVPAVLAAVRTDRPLPDLTQYTTADSTLSGNPWYVDIEVQHLGNGSPIVAVQRSALIKANTAICRRMGWDPRYRLIGHLEWAPKRKTDPRWDGNANPMPQIRKDTLVAIKEDDMPLTADDIKKIWEYPVPDEDDGLGTRGAVHALRQAWGYARDASIDAAVARRIAETSAGSSTPLSPAQIAAIADAVADEFAERLTG
jgi:hypothetical protein